MDKKKKYINISHLQLEEKCCGCGACVSICPIKCVSLTLDKKGFYNPVVNNNCLNCSKCINVCQILKINNYPKSEKYYACKSRNDTIRLRSSSGGLFYELCALFYGLYGTSAVFWGASYDRDLNVVHSCVSFSEIHLLMGSKYVQSNMGASYYIIGEQLRNGKNVLFSGTGCQCSGLMHYLKCANISFERLFMIDIICHGVPSVKVWQDYIKAIESKTGKKIASFIFRDKNVSWRGINPHIIFSDGSEYENDKLVYSYRRLFGNLILNDICHDCKYTNLNRCGDLTIGDFWGVEKYFPELDDDKGVSLCLVNSEKGKIIFDNAKKCIESIKLNELQIMQPQLSSPTEKNIRHFLFWRDYVKYGYLYVSEKYVNDSLVHGIMRKLYNYLKNIRFFKK